MRFERSKDRRRVKDQNRTRRPLLYIFKRTHTHTVHPCHQRKERKVRARGDPSAFSVNPDEARDSQPGGVLNVSPLYVVRVQIVITPLFSGCKCVHLVHAPCPPSIPVLLESGGEKQICPSLLQRHQIIACETQDALVLYGSIFLLRQEFTTWRGRRAASYSPTPPERDLPVLSL